MLKVRKLTVNNFEENTYILIDEATSKAAIIDPGMLTDYEKKKFDDFIANEGIKIDQVILTHAHLDHCFGASYVHDKYGVPVKGHPDDEPLLAGVKAQAISFGMPGIISSEPSFDVRLKAGETITIGESSLKVIHVPGHSPGGIALYSSEDGFVLVGDSLFRGSIGRTDLPGGDHATLLDAIKRGLFTLPGDTLVLPGHGPVTTIAEEKANNPFFRD